MKKTLTLLSLFLLSIIPLCAIDDIVFNMPIHHLELYGEEGRNLFPKDENGNPFLWDYQIRGFFKSAAQAGSYMGGDKKLAAYKKKIDLLVFVAERKIPFVLPEGKEMGNCQRPLRAQTMQGERVALANSETVPAGSTVEFTIQILEDKLASYVEDWLDFGKFNGIGQWRNASHGRFTWERVA